MAPLPPPPGASDPFPSLDLLPDRISVLRAGLGVSRMEALVILDVAVGKSVSEIAAELDRSESTVKGHIESVSHKFGTHNVKQVAALVVATLWWRAWADAGR